jgi:hypothetical protein
VNSLIRIRPVQRSISSTSSIRREDVTHSCRVFGHCHEWHFLHAEVVRQRRWLLFSVRLAQRANVHRVGKDDPNSARCGSTPIRFLTDGPLPGLRYFSNSRTLNCTCLRSGQLFTKAWFSSSLVLAAQPNQESRRTRPKRAFPFYSAPINLLAYNSDTMSPADLPWWGWLVGGSGGFVVGFLLVSGDDNWFTVSLGWVLTVAGCLSVLIGIIRFLKWV